MVPGGQTGPLMFSRSYLFPEPILSDLAATRCRWRHETWGWADAVQIRCDGGVSFGIMRG
jgi:hypothetical protein